MAIRVSLKPVANLNRAPTGSFSWETGRALHRMSVAFGFAAGDFIAGIEIIRQVRETLERDARLAREFHRRLTLH